MALWTLEDDFIDGADDAYCELCGAPYDDLGWCSCSWEAVDSYRDEATAYDEERGA